MAVTKIILNHQDYFCYKEKGKRKKAKVKSEMKKYSSVEEYINDLEDLQKDKILEMISIIENSVDFVEIKINYGIIALAFVKGGKRDQQMMIAAYKNHISLYPQPDTIEYFIDQLKDFKISKGTVQFSLKEELPRDLITEMTKYKFKKINSDF